MAWRILLSLLVLAGMRAGACEVQPAQIAFSGTAFASSPFEIRDQHVVFFPGGGREVSLHYNFRDGWCYAAASEGHPARGCLKNSSLSIRDLKGRVVARVRARKTILQARLVEAGRDLGKRIVFRAESDALELKGWNCPNAKFLSCVGADLKTYIEEPGDQISPRPSLKKIDLAKRMGHYSATCSGVHELSE